MGISDIRGWRVLLLSIEGADYSSHFYVGRSRLLCMTQHTFEIQGVQGSHGFGFGLGAQLDLYCCQYESKFEVCLPCHVSASGAGASCPHLHVS